jgi:hypothetical protein
MPAGAASQVSSATQHPDCDSTVTAGWIAELEASRNPFDEETLEGIASRMNAKTMIQVSGCGQDNGQSPVDLGSDGVIESKDCYSRRADRGKRSLSRRERRLVFGAAATTQRPKSRLLNKLPLLESRAIGSSFTHRHQKQRDTRPAGYLGGDTT